MIGARPDPERGHHRAPAAAAPSSSTSATLPSRVSVVAWCASSSAAVSSASRSGARHPMGASARRQSRASTAYSPTWPALRVSQWSAAICSGAAHGASARSHGSSRGDVAPAPQRSLENQAISADHASGARNRRAVITYPRVSQGPKVDNLRSLNIG